MTLDEFVLLAKVLKSAYTAPSFLPDEYSVKVWHKFLADLPFDIANLAVQQYIATNRFPPTISDIRESTAGLMAGERKDWSESWKWVCRCISVYGMPNEAKAYADMDEYTKEAVKRIGWKNLCMSQNQTADRANYRMIYESVVKEKLNQLALPEGIRLKLKDTKLLGDADD